jgi:hypothetical protein
VKMVIARSQDSAAVFLRFDLRPVTSPKSEYLKIRNVPRAKHTWSVRESLEKVEHGQPG